MRIEYGAPRFSKDFVTEMLLTEKLKEGDEVDVVELLGSEPIFVENKLIILTSDGDLKVYK